ncbi:hypothetical protein [Alteromonas lipolytica]|uniref:PEP-CTERM protein-sorting domain-containing protein n=1 Tax=Alteromonas lipolytica TaxID=1856405 RepID=A0A1E8FD89_9ALTE|nr:hypothetical protein [Alteromonas lipolytica]OFI33879.1 hypothetical protein BFC17_20140 [Alteromonas lipolytica]GGF67571.1 hypothetical protein GCM10011338_19710 [Alteromonas lipolytica]
MKKFVLALVVALFACGQANASFISTVTGADMAGMEVTVTFEDNSSETLVWQTFTQDPSVDYLEGFSGGVQSNNWSLVQAGDSIGNFVGYPLGLWTLTNQSDQGILSVFINAIAGNVVFDILFGDDSANGSSDGRPFLAMDPMNASFGSNYQDETFGTMLLSNRGDVILAGGSRTLFLVDTDKIASDVSTPGNMGILLLALGSLFAARRRTKLF